MSAPNSKVTIACPYISVFVLIVLVFYNISSPVAVVPDYGEPTDAVRQAYLEFLDRHTLNS